MPACPRCALAALVLLAAAVTGCDSNNPDDIERYQGRFAFTQLQFSNGALDVDVDGRLNASQSEIEINGNSAFVKFRYADGSECGATEESSGAAVMNVTAGRTSVTLSARGGDDRDVLQCLLLPGSFRLETTEAETNARTLTLELDRSGVNLQEYDPTTYNSGFRDQSGTLSLTLTRRAS